MEPIEFAQMTTTWAKDQPPYLPLPAYTDERETISCWRLSWRDRLTAFFRGRLWLRQMNFGSALQPQAPTFVCPFRQNDQAREAGNVAEMPGL
jgi:hypothetical protein